MGHQRHNLRDLIYIHYLAPPHSAEDIVIIAIVDRVWLEILVLLFRHLAQFCRVETYGPILSRLWTKIREIRAVCNSWSRTAVYVMFRSEDIGR